MWEWGLSRTTILFPCQSNHFHHFFITAGALVAVTTAVSAQARCCSTFHYVFVCVCLWVGVRLFSNVYCHTNHLRTHQVLYKGKLIHPGYLCVPDQTTAHQQSRPHYQETSLSFSLLHGSPPKPPVPDYLDHPKHPNLTGQPDQSYHFDRSKELPKR